MKVLKILSRIILISFIGLIVAVSETPVHARKEKTTISKLKLRSDDKDSLGITKTQSNKRSRASDPNITVSLLEDTLLASSTNLDSFLQLAGYDKPVSASRETIHATNLMQDSTISTVSFLITYLDYQKRELHRRQVDINVDLPAGQTQLISFPTWDLQRSFYYRKSTKPRRAAAPYDIKIELLSICTYPENAD